MIQGSWTKGAQRVLELSARLSASLGGTYIGTEHLLLALMKEEDCLAGKVLMEAKVKEDRLLELIGKLVQPSRSAEEEDMQGGIILADALEPEEDLPVQKEALEETPRLVWVKDAALEDAASRMEEAAGTGHLLLALLRDRESVAVRLLYTMEVNIQKLYAATLIAMGGDSAAAARELSQSQKSGEGGTPTLDAFSRDLTQMAREGRLDPILGREKEIGRLVQILCRRTKNNPCLVGEPGVGKTAIVEGLAQRMVRGLLPDTISGRRVVVLDLSAMVAGTKYRGEFEQRIRNLIDEVYAHPGILLFIDELHTIIGAGSAEGTLDAANILKPALSRGEIQIIGATTMEEYRKYIEKDAALERRFQPVVVEEPSVAETVEILKGICPYYEKHHGVSFAEEAIVAAAELSHRYVHDRNLPDKAIDVLDEAGAAVRLSMFSSPKGAEDMEEGAEKELSLALEEALKSGDLAEAKRVRLRQEKLESEKKELILSRRGEGLRQVTVGDVADVISGWTKIPVSSLTEKEQYRLARLEEELHKRVIGQEEAVKAVASAVRRGRVGLGDPHRPIGSFLFLGPTGVGKTELSKALAEAVFGSEQNMIRIDMSEYMEKFTVSRLIGSPPGYVGFEDGGQLSEKVRRNPYCVVLFDEIEKAHPDVFNILLQVLDDGVITDSHGRKVDFSQSIIMTSNAGAQAIVEPKRLGFSAREDETADYEHMKAGVMEEVKRIFRPEFINRIDEIMVFHMLTKEEIRKIVDILLTDLLRRSESQMKITLVVEDCLREDIAKVGFDPKFGARPLRRQIQEKIEDGLAQEILLGHFAAGDTVHASLRDGKVVFFREGEEAIEG